jgi:hypothetical protein
MQDETKANILCGYASISASEQSAGCFVQNQAAQKRLSIRVVGKRNEFAGEIEAIAWAWVTYGKNPTNLSHGLHTKTILCTRPRTTLPEADCPYAAPKRMSVL